MIIKRRINFSIQSQKKAASRVRMRVSYCGNRLEFQTGIIINESDWDSDRQCVISGTTGSSLVDDMNDTLSSMKTKIIDVFHQFEVLRHVPTPDELRSVFNGDEIDINELIENETSNQQHLPYAKVDTKTSKKQKKEKVKTLWDCYDEFVKVNGKLNDWTPATFEKFSALRNHLFKFDKKLTFEKFDEDGIADFVEFLSKKRKLKNTTISKQMGFLRWFLRWCYEKGYNKNHTFEYYKPKLKTASKRVIFLTESELEKVEKLVIPKKREALEAVRDVFLFCCYTGLRYSDVEKLTWADIHDNKIEIVTKKTSDRILIDFNKKSMAILKKYSDRHLPGNKVLPVISNQKMNKQVKSLCKLAGIDEQVKLTSYEGNKRIDVVRPKYELVGTHTGRRTFICTALSKGIPPNIVMKWTGHSDYKAMKPYIDVADEVKSLYMKKFDEE